MNLEAAMGQGTISRERQLELDRELAARVLRGEALPAQARYDLAERLKDANEFGYARKLFSGLRAGNDFSALAKSAVRVGQREALCTYKDPDLPSSERFCLALEILDGVDPLEQKASDRQETLCLRGAILKRRWQIEGQSADLEISVGYYLSAYELGFEHAKGVLGDEEPGLNGLDGDVGYAGINAAFLLELSAREQAKQACKVNRRSDAAAQSVTKARDIREKIVARLPKLKGQYAKQWWYHVTLAEARFGLGQFDQAFKGLGEFNQARELDYAGPPHPEDLPRWELETFVTQVGALAQLRADLTALLDPTEDGKARAQEDRLKAEQALRNYLGKLAPGVERASTGKVGLGLSGGGFRASLFHIGVLAQLAERNLLRRVEVLSCVSGGSIVGAHFYLEVRHLLRHKPEADIQRDDYVAVVNRLEKDFLQGVQRNIRSRVFGGIWSNLRAFLQPSYTTTRRLGELYEHELYSRVPDGHQGPRYLNELFIVPEGEVADFTPKYDNWRRSAKVPVLVLNATTLNTGHLWQFTASFMGEPPSRIDSEIESNYRLRRMYYSEAPRLRDRWRRPIFSIFAPPDYQRFRLGDAVASSSCVPGLFEPMMLPDLFDGKNVGLVDGGVYDNQGIATLLEQDCTVMIVSDASGQIDALDHPSVDRLGVPLRAFGVSMARVRQSQYQELDARRRSGLLKGLAFLHLTKDLDSGLVDWRECQDPHDATDDGRPAERRGVLTSYGMQKRVQRLIAGIRTDLDSFTDVEAYALMTSGYRMAETELDRLDLPDARREPRDWRFLEVERLLAPGAGYDDLQTQLDVARLTAGKIWRLSWPLTALGVGLVVTAAAGTVVLWFQYRSLVLLTVEGLGTFLFCTALALMFPYLVRIIRYRQSMKQIGIKALLAVVLAVVFKLHLALFDPLFLRRGRVARLARQRQNESSSP